MFLVLIVYLCRHSYLSEVDNSGVGQKMTEHSMWLTGEFRGDNIRNVFWRCDKCGVSIPTQEEAIRHVRQAHQEDTITPHLNDVGKDLAQLYYFPHATKELATYLAQRLEQDFCSGMGAVRQFVSMQDVTNREPIFVKSSKELFNRVVNIMCYVRYMIEQRNNHRC